MQLLLPSVAPRFFDSGVQPAYTSNTRTYRAIASQGQPNHVLTKTITHTVVSKDADSEVELVHVQNIRNTEGRFVDSNVFVVKMTANGGVVV